MTGAIEHVLTPLAEGDVVVHLSLVAIDIVIQSKNLRGSTEAAAKLPSLCRLTWAF
jgi:hypothetical protein